MANKKIKFKIKKMSIWDVDKILLQKYNITHATTQKYPEDIKRDLLFDLETHAVKKLS